MALGLKKNERIIQIGGRASNLSQAQLLTVQKKLSKAWPDYHFEIKFIETRGDEDQKTPLPEIGLKGVFTAALEEALFEGRIDLAVHSQKDMPVENPEGLQTGAVLERESPNDVLITRHQGSLLELPKHAKVGTSSARRKAQLLNIRPDLEISSLRGNVDTRLKKSADLDGIILAYAGLKRLGLESNASYIIPTDLMLPAPAQGAIAVQCRSDEFYTRLLAPIKEQATERCTRAERAFLKALGGGCSLPISALAQMDGELIKLTGQVLSPDGQKSIKEELSGENPEQLGSKLAEICIQKGAHELLGG